jgi:hypothetical protein
MLELALIAQLNTTSGIPQEVIATAVDTGHTIQLLNESAFYFLTGCYYQTQDYYYCLDATEDFLVDVIIDIESYRTYLQWSGT